mmetsp:Transcript_9607/g.9265  ORF Transcript_9607/g.9265 Transcript_9607/m.9265 type:complete len:314 (+) Transcript_9607:2193-3134(+)
MVSETAWTIFPHLTKVFEKNKKSFGNLLDALNQYILHGLPQLISNQAQMKMLVDMGTTAMYTIESNMTIQNAEGAIFLQLLFQVFRETDALNQFFQQILDNGTERLRIQPMSDGLKRQLALMYLCAIAYNSQATFNYLEQNGITEEILNKIFEVSEQLFNSYERKVYVIGMSCLIASQHIPTTLVNNIKMIIEKSVSVLTKQRFIEQKSLRKAGKKELKDDGDSDEEEDEEGEDSDYEPSDNEEDEEESKKEDKEKDAELHEEEENKEESKGGEGEEQKEGGKEDADTEDEEDSELDDEENGMFDLNITLDML